MKSGWPQRKDQRLGVIVAVDDHPHPYWGIVVAQGKSVPNGGEGQLADLMQADVFWGAFVKAHLVVQWRIGRARNWQRERDNTQEK